MIEDDVLEKAMEAFNKEQEQAKKKRKFATYIEKTKIMMEAMSVISVLRRRGWDFLQIARAVNVSEQTIKNWACGKFAPHPNNLLALRRIKETEAL